MILLQRLAVATVIALALSIPAARAGGVGFSEVRIAADGGKPLTVGVWYPTDAPAKARPVGPFSQTVASDGPVVGERLPLAVMSHGNRNVRQPLRHRPRPGGGGLRRGRRQSRWRYL